MLKSFKRLLTLAASLLLGLVAQAEAPATDQAPGQNRTMAPAAGGNRAAVIERANRRGVLNAARAAAAARQQAALKAKGGKIDPKVLGTNPAAAPRQAAPVASGGKLAGLIVAPGTGTPGPGFQLAQPDYMFGTASNWHYTKPIHKFIDTLPGLSAAHPNNLGNFIPVAKPMAVNPYDANSDYYEIGVTEYTQKVHTELNATKFRGYKDLNPLAENTINGANSSNYLGPVIIATKDRAVRVKMTNMLPKGPADPVTKRRPGDLFLPVDTTLMGAGIGLNGGVETFTENRAEFHLHGGLSPWISDGTPHQWVTPAGETTSYPKGAVFQNVPDMATGATATDGVATYYWTNQQSGRLMFYHDHSFGLTRLNVYAGEAAGYLITSPTDEKLINAGIIPDQGDPAGVYRYGIPLIIQDKTFVDTTTLGTVGTAGGSDPTWDVVNFGGDGSLWYPHVYMPNQNPADISGANAMGRWDYGPWFWPPVTAAAGLVHGEQPIVGDPNGTTYPGTPNPSLVPEAFMDTPLVNGTPYPTTTVDPKAYRFRILNAANDRMWNLSLFVADATGKDVTMVPAAPPAPVVPPAVSTWPALWPTDGRDGGVPNPLSAGPSFIQIGNESGFLPTPVVIPPQPVGYEYNRRNIVVLNVLNHGLFLGPAERADVIVDFSAFAGKTLILYNDAPAPVPAFDSRLDYYTGDIDQSTSGGAATTLPGFGPNTRTIMQIVVNPGVNPAFNIAALNAAFTTTATSQGAFAEAQHLPIVPETAYNSALNRAVTRDSWARIQDFSFYPNAIAPALPGYVATENGVQVNPTFLNKAIQELFELDYGRMNATLGVEVPGTNFNIQTTIPLGYRDPITEVLNDGQTQIWKITHNGVDTHPVHFHLFDVQVINRVGWDGAVRMPDANELGWKETVRMSPLEDIIVAFRPLSPRLPLALFGGPIPNSMRSMDVLQPANGTVNATDPATGNQAAGYSNAPQSFGWEYVWHCHILGHEENDFMRPVSLIVATTVPSDPTTLTATTLISPNRADLAWTDTSSNETGFSIQRRLSGVGAFVEIGTTVPNQNRYSDFTILPATSYDYQVVAYNQAGLSGPTVPFATVGAQPMGFSGLVYSVVAGVNVPTPGVLITFAGASPNATVPLPANTTATTDATGAYTVSLPYNWTGTVTPALAGFAFTPVNLALTGLLSNLAGQNFVARPVVTISGTVTTAAAVPMAGVTITLSNGGGTAITDGTGTYTATVSSGWTGTATPSLLHYTFAPIAPVTGVYANVIVDQPLQNYTGTQVVVLSGTVALGVGTPVAGVLVTFNPGVTATTNAAGFYTITLPAPYTGTIVPSKLNYAFTPATSVAFAGLTTDTTQNFVAAGIVTVSGTFTSTFPAGPLAGATVTYSGNAQVAIVDALGNYSMTVPSPLNGTLTPAAAPLANTMGYAFTPVSLGYNTATDVTKANFVATPQITLSGKVQLGAGTPAPAYLAGATVTFSTGQVVTSNATGDYSLVVNAPYSGTVTAVKAGYFITPLAPQVITAAGVNTVIPNFTAVPAVIVSGLVTTNGAPAVPLAGVTITFMDTRVIPAISAGTVVTDVNGLYTHYVPSGFTGTITPTRLNWAFTPTSRTLNNLTVAPAGQNFTARATVTVTGNVSTWTALGGIQPVAGVLVSFSNGGGSVTTDVAGNYSRILNSGWTGNITPTGRGLIYSPAGSPSSPAAVTIGAPGLSLASNLIYNFATVQTIAGRMRAQVNGQGVGIPGGTITYTGTGTWTSGTATSDVNGNFTLRVATGWSGTVTFTQGTTIYTTWTPASLPYTNLVANVAGLRINGI